MIILWLLCYIKKTHTNDLRCLVIAYEVKKKEEDTICSIFHFFIKKINFKSIKIINKKKENLIKFFYKKIKKTLNQKKIIKKESHKAKDSCWCF